MTIDRRTLLGAALAMTSTAALPRRSRAQSKTVKLHSRSAHEDHPRPFGRCWPSHR